MNNDICKLSLRLQAQSKLIIIAETEEEFNKLKVEILQIALKFGMMQFKDEYYRIAK